MHARVYVLGHGINHSEWNSTGLEILSLGVFLLGVSLFGASGIYKI